MKQCKEPGCVSHALNDSPESGYCDVCLYKKPLLDMLALLHRDGGHYTVKNGIQKSTNKAIKIILKLIQKNQTNGD